MDHELIQFALTAFVTLLVVVDPLGAVPLFVGMLQPLPIRERRAVLTRAVTIAFTVAIFFLLTGRTILSYLGVSVHAIGISGGVLLFLTALPMLFGQRAGLQAPEQGEQPASGEDIAIFPMAIPLLSGPGTIASVLLLTDQGGTPERIGIVALAITVVYLLSGLILHAGERTMRRVREGKLHVVTRVMGILLAGLAAQYVLNGIAGYYATLVGP